MNNNDDDKIEGLEKTKYKRSNQPSQASKETTKTAAKAAANAYLGPAGGKAVDVLSKTKLGDAVLTKGAKALEKNPMGKQMSQMASNSGALNAANGAMGSSSGGSGQAPSSSGSAPNSSMNLNDGEKDSGLLGGLMGGSSKSGSGLLGGSGSSDGSMNDETTNPTASDMIFSFVKKHGIKFIPPIFGFLFFIIIILGVIGVILGPADTVIQFFRDAWDGLKTLVGYKSDEEWELEYYKKLDEVQEKLNKKYGVCIDVNLITATLTVNVESDEYVEEGQDEVDSEAQGGSELGIQGADYKKMIQQIELLGNMQIKRTVYGLDKRVLANNSGSGVSNDYCRDEASEYLVDSEDDINQFKYSDSFLGNVYHILKESDIPVRISNTKRDVASNDIKPGFVKFFTRKANEERNIEYKFFVPAYTIKEEKDANGNIVIKKECYDSVPTDSYDFAELDVGSLNEMEDNVYYWNLLDHFIADYYKEYLPKVSGEIVIGSEEYEKIKKIIEDIYLLYNEMGPSRVCESVSAKNQCVYSNGGTGEAMQNVKVSLLQCADDTRFDPIPNETIVDLETYITGVVYAENGGSKNYEALKAQAVAARTYALTNYDKIETDSSGNTLIKLRNCTERQVYCDPNKGCWSNNKTAGGTVHSGQDTSKPYSKPPLPSTSQVWNAVRETAGEVIYDSNGKILSIGYTSTQQNKWNSMAADYVTMLMDTYPDADSINSECKVVGDVVGDGTQDGELVPTVCSNNSFNSPYWTTLNVFNKPQCTWYAYGRALQILTENAGMNVNDARGLMNKMFTSSSGRHAGVWYSMNAQTQTFSASTNIDDARPGAIIVWAGTGFGHVAIVESVQKNSDGTISSVTLTQGNVSGKECGNDTYNRGQMETQNYDKRGRHFVGYIYLLN